MGFEKSRIGLDRRRFMTTVAGLASVGAGVRAAGTDQAPPSTRPAAPQQWDLSWLDQLKGKHKQLFDVGNTDLSGDVPTPLRLPNNYLNGFRDVFHAEPPDVNVIIGIQHVAFPINASDALWETYLLGERWNIKDPETGKIATRNVFLGQTSGGSGQFVRPLQARGAIFWQCNIALQGVIAQLARQSGKSPDVVRAEIVAGLNPGVKIVPAHTLLVGLVQEHGFTYEKP